jgi:Flp pilus assembly protein TadG
MRKNRLLHFGILRALGRDQAGGAIVETALAVNFLFLFLLGALEFGRVTYASMAVTNAAKAGAQYGAQGTAYCTDTDNTSAQNGGIQKAAQNEAGWVYSQNASSFQTTSSLSYICSDDTAVTDLTNLNNDCKTSQLERIVTVTSTVSFKPIIHVPGTPTTYSLTGGATQKVMVQ